MANGIKQQGDILINAVNDAWFVHQAGKDIHFSLALFRAVEYRKPLVRVTNNGNSAVVSSTGELIPDSILPPAQQSYTTVTVPIADIETFYQRYPKAFMIFAFIIASISLIKRHKTYG